MSVDDFAITRRGVKFFDGDFPRLVKVLEDLAGSFDRLARTTAAASHAAGDSQTLDDITAVLDGTEWNADTVDAVAQLVRESGRRVRDVGER